jgi:hypothetical protein
MTRKLQFAPESDAGKPLVRVDRERVQTGGIRELRVNDEVVDSYPDDPQKGPTCQNDNDWNKNFVIIKQAMRQRRRKILDES